MAFHFSRDTKVFMKFQGTDGAKDALYEIPVLDGYSFSQATNSSEITLNEAADSSGNSKRGRAMFNDSFAPAEWSFSTYMRPTTSGSSTSAFASNAHAGESKKFAVEGPLWAAMSATTYALGVGSSDSITEASFEPNVFNFQNSNKVALGVFDLYFVLGAAKDTATSLYTTGTEGVTIYKISDCSVGSASIDFDIEGLAQVAWSGQGKKIKEVTQLKTTAGATSPAVTGEEYSTNGLVNEGIASTSNYIRQKLTSLAIAFDLSDSTGAPSGVASDGETQLGADKTYSVVLTGGNITIENNLTYLTPETLGSVNQPLGHVMGTRSVSGNFTCYLNNAADGSMDLLEDLHEADTVITNSFDMTFSIGGASAPKVEVAVPNCHLELPTHTIDDVIGVDVNFHALPADLSSATASSSANEITLTYTS